MLLIITVSWSRLLALILDKAIALEPLSRNAGERDII